MVQVQTMVLGGTEASEGVISFCEVVMLAKKEAERESEKLQFSF